MARLLVLEPDSVLKRTYVSFLKSKGHKVEAVSDAQSAVDSADKHKPDLVILELQLPEHNGIEFLYEFKSYPEWQSVPIIVQSFVPAHEFGTQSDFWQRLGIVAYHYKPRTSLRQLLTTVEEQLSPA